MKGTSTKEPIVYKQPTEEQREQMMDVVIDEFDFDKVHRVMTFLEWKWINEHQILEVPSVPRLKQTARRLLREAYRCWNKFGYSSGVTGSGGFRATFYEAGEDGDANFQLLFAVDEQHSYDYYTPNYPEK
jgi:hypothetical protein